MQAVSLLAENLANNGLSGRGCTFIGLWLLFSDSLSTDSSDYQNRLEPITIRSGVRRRLAAIPS